MPELISGPQSHVTLPPPASAEKRRLVKTSQFTEELETYGKALAEKNHVHFEAIHEYLPEDLELDLFLSRPLLLKLIEASFQYAKPGGIIVFVSRTYANELIFSLHVESTITPKKGASALMKELIAVNGAYLGCDVKAGPTPGGSRFIADGPDGKVIIELDKLHGTTLELRLDLPGNPSSGWLRTGT